jgi:hypothetical protein
MTDHAALAERIHGILVRAGIGFTPSKDGLEFFGLPWPLHHQLHAIEPRCI